MVRTVLFAGSTNWPYRHRVERFAEESLIGLGPGDTLVVIHGDHPEGVDRAVRDWAEAARERWRADPARHPEVREQRYPLTPQQRRDADTVARRDAIMVAENTDDIAVGYILLLGRDPLAMNCLRLAWAAGLSLEVVGHNARHRARQGRTAATVG